MRATRFRLAAVALAAAALVTVSAGSAVADTGMSSKPTVAEIAASNDDFSTLVTAVTAAGLGDTLNGSGPFTVFAPTNEAFAKLPPDQLQAILANPALGGQGIADYASKPGTLVVAPYDWVAQLITQAEAVGITLVWSGVGAAILYVIIDKLWGFRVSEEVEREGLDIAEHGERAYHY